MSNKDPQTPKKRQPPAPLQLPTPPPTDRKHRGKCTPLFLPSSPSPSTSPSYALLHESLHFRPDGTILGSAPHPVHRALTPVGGLLQNDPFGSSHHNQDDVNDLDEYMNFTDGVNELGPPPKWKTVTTGTQTTPAPTQEKAPLQPNLAETKLRVKEETQQAPSCTTMVLWQAPKAHQKVEDDSSSDEIVCTGERQTEAALSSKPAQHTQPRRHDSRKRKTAEPEEASDDEAPSERKKELERRKKRSQEQVVRKDKQERPDKSHRSSSAGKKEPVGNTKPAKKSRTERSPSSATLREVTSDDEIEFLGERTQPVARGSGSQTEGLHPSQLRINLMSKFHSIRDVLTRARTLSWTA
jgi:hypothetical protein